MPSVTLTADHVQHFAAASLSLLQQLCTVDNGIFLYGWCEHHFVSELKMNIFFQTNIVKQFFEWLCVSGSLLQLLLEYCDSLKTDISQSSVATYLRCGGIFKYDFVANLPMNLSVKEYKEIG